MRSFVASVTLAVALAWSPLAMADTRTNTIGDQSGQPFKADCGRDEALVGFAYNSDQLLFAVSPLCRGVADNALAGAVSTPKTAVGSDGGKQSAEPEACTGMADGMAIDRLDVWLDPGLRVHHVGATCHVISGSKAGVLLKATFNSDTVAANSAAHRSASCGSGAYATGLVGTVNNGAIGSLGLVCHKTDSTDTASTKAGNSGDTPPAADTGPDTTASDNAGTPPTEKPVIYGRGGVVVVGSDTTIYSKPEGKEVGYLRQGNDVKVVACDHHGKGWCQITIPKKGYVWGPDIFTN